MEKSNKPEKDRSFSVSLERIAQLLRSEVKLKDRETKVLPGSSAGSLNNTIMQVAKMLRTEVKAHPPVEKRSWSVENN